MARLAPYATVWGPVCGPVGGCVQPFVEPCAEPCVDPCAEPCVEPCVEASALPHTELHVHTNTFHASNPALLPFDVKNNDWRGSGFCRILLPGALCGALCGGIA